MFFNENFPWLLSFLAALVLINRASIDLFRSSLYNTAAKIGTNVIIRASVHTHFPWKVTIGDYSWIGDGVVLYSLADINIGNNVVISQKSYLCAGSHDYRYVEFPTTNSPITIEDECWLATDVFVAPGITVGKGTVVGARSSVFKSLPAGKICAGSPAVCFRDRETLSSFKQSHHPTD
ncbi:colanic acid biosynthesis acetyltransferase WcaF [Segetibacter sp. 3557_3]|nr:colanic acid biosynthesis acetyltransferase WcaF [Segetibacter sp. 3557_3]